MKWYVSMTVKCSRLKLGWVWEKVCRQQKTNLIYSVFPLYAFWLDSDGSLQVNWVFWILSIKIWGKKQRRQSSVEMQHAKEYRKAERKFTGQKDRRKLKNLFGYRLKWTHFQLIKFNIVKLHRAILCSSCNTPATLFFLWRNKQKSFSEISILEESRKITTFLSLVKTEVSYEIFWW